jgi:hypothetical protein
MTPHYRKKNGWVYQQPGEESSVDGDFITLRNCHGDLAKYKHYPFTDRLSLYRIGEAATNSKVGHEVT